MVTFEEVESQLKALGVNYHFWGKPEMIELQHILIPGEKIQVCINGRYSGGLATFCATDQRLLLIDKKLFFLTVVDTRYDMITEVDFGAQLFSGTLSVCTPTKTMVFNTFHPKTLRKLASYIQQRVMEIRNQSGVTAPTADQQPEPVEQPVQYQQPEPQPAPFAAPIPAQVVQAQPSYTSDEYTTTTPMAQLLQPDEPATASVELTELPIPHLRNPYMGAPLMMRRRIGRFGSIASTTPPPAKL